MSFPELVQSELATARQVLPSIESMPLALRGLLLRYEVLQRSILKCIVEQRPPRYVRYHLARLAADCQRAAEDLGLEDKADESQGSS